MSQNNVHPIKITNIGESTLVLDLKNGSAPDPNHKHLEIPAGATPGNGNYEPDAHGCVGFKVKHDSNLKNPILKLVIGESKPDYDLDIIGNSQYFKLKILVQQMKTNGDTNVEVGVEEPTLPPTQKQKPKGK